MRIRKNARLLELMLSSSANPPEAIFQTTPHLCQLNQSPWDVLPISTSSTTSSFPSPNPHLLPPPPSNSTSSSYPTQNQLEGGEYSLSENASIGDSICGFGSFASMKVEMAAAAAKEDDAAPNLLMGLNVNNKFEASNGIDDDDDDEMEEMKMCNKTNGKGWHCRKEAKKEYSSCRRHNNNNNNSISSYRKSEKSLPSLPPLSRKVVTGGVPRRRGRGPGKKASTSNPYEFYYYSGFGPLWGKKRGGERNGENKRSEMENNVEKEDSPSSSSQIEHNNEVEKEEEAEAVGFMEDEDDSGGGDDHDNGRKRARKPVKARSLKSLM